MPWWLGVTRARIRGLEPHCATQPLPARRGRCPRVLRPVTWPWPRGGVPDRRARYGQPYRSRCRPRGDRKSWPRISATALSRRCSGWSLQGCRGLRSTRRSTPPTAWSGTGRIATWPSAGPPRGSTMWSTCRLRALPRFGSSPLLPCCRRQVPPAPSARCAGTRGVTARPTPGGPEAAVAGALGLRLAGPRVYDGVLVNDAWMGEGSSDADGRSIRRSAEALSRRVPHAGRRRSPDCVACYLMRDSRAISSSASQSTWRSTCSASASSVASSSSS